LKHGDVQSLGKPESERGGGLGGGGGGVGGWGVFGGRGGLWGGGGECVLGWGVGVRGGVGWVLVGWVYSFLGVLWVFVFVVFVCGLATLLSSQTVKFSRTGKRSR